MRFGGGAVTSGVPTPFFGSRLRRQIFNLTIPPAVQATSYLMLDVQFRACLHEGGGPQVGEVTRGGSPHLTCKRDQITLK